MPTITYDSVNLQTTRGVIIRTINHETTPDKDLSDLKPTNQDGRIIIEDTFGMKTIIVRGVLSATTEALLEAAMDDLNELCARKDKNLDISYGGGTRRYVCRLAKVDFSERDHYHILYVPVTISFIVPGGIGQDTAATTANTSANITAVTTAVAMTFAGSYKPKPKHKVTINTLGNADVIRITNTDTGDYMEVDIPGFVGTDYLEIDEEAQTVKKNGTTNLNFRGKFPSVKPGVNNLTLTVYGSGDTEDQSQKVNTSGARSVIYTNGAILPQQAQSFVLDQSGRIGKIEVFVNKDGSPTGKMQWHMRYDANGVPNMTASRPGNEEFEIAVAGIPGTMAKTEAPKASGSVYLTAGIKYWLFYNPAVITADASNFVCWWYSNIATDYIKGKAMANKASGQPYYDGVGNASNTPGGVDLGQFDFEFVIHRGDGAAASHNITWLTTYTKKYL